MDRKDIKRVVGDTTHVAQEKGKDALAQAQQYLEQAGDYIAPRAQEALTQAQEFVTPLAQDARKKGAALAAHTMDTLQPKLEDALDKVSPALEDAYAKLAPAIDAAAEKVQKEVLPRLTELLHEAAELPVVAEASDRAKATVAALSGELVVPEKKKGNKAATVAKVVIAGGLLAGVVLAIKKFLEPSDAGWQAHEPSSPYVPTAARTVVDDVEESFTEAKAKVADVAEEAADKVSDAADAVADKAAEVADEVAEKVADVAEGDAAPFVDSPYGAGSYVGSEPPAGFVIKGNERSMKFHVVGNGGYERTIADVWFDSEDAARAAGFTKAQR